MELSNQHDAYFSLSNDKVSQHRFIDALMIVRFKLMHPYPYSEFKVGEIITPRGSAKIDLYKLCSANFRELRWHEERKQVDLPRYLKSKKFNMVVKLDSIVGDIAIIEDHTGSKCQMNICDFAPAAPYEFKEYIERKSSK